MNAPNIVIPFDFPFAILEHRNNPDPTKKLVYAVADGQYTYGPLSLFQYHNDEKYSKIIQNDLPTPLPCKEFYIIESGFSTDDAIEIIDAKRGRLYIKEINQEPQEIRMKELIQEISECRNEIQSLKSLFLSEDRATHQSTSVKQRARSAIINTPPTRSQSVTTNRILLKNVKSSGYGQHSPMPKRSLRK